MNVISGIGWITRQEYGCAIKQLRRPYNDIKSLRSHLQNESILLYPVKGFGKFDAVSKRTCCAVALALHDAGMPYSADYKQDIGILGTNTDGCLQSNADFFRDFVENGRTLGRANLFVYTLPSSPMADAAIYFKCQGPVLYMFFPQKQIPSLLRYSDKMICRGEAPAMLAVRASEDDAVCFVMRREQDVIETNVLELEDVVGRIETASLLEEMIGMF